MILMQVGMYKAHYHRTALTYIYTHMEIISAWHTVPARNKNCKILCNHIMSSCIPVKILPYPHERGPTMEYQPIPQSRPNIRYTAHGPFFMKVRTKSMNHPTNSCWWLLKEKRGERVYYNSSVFPQRRRFLSWTIDERLSGTVFETEKSLRWWVLISVPS